MVGELKNLRPATEVHYLFKDEKFILISKRVPFNLWRGSYFRAFLFKQTAMLH